MVDLVRRTNFGWLPDIPDHRDIMFKATNAPLMLPPAIDLTNRAEWPEPYDQGDLGSCVAQAIAGAVYYEKIKRLTAGGKYAGMNEFLSNKQLFHPSRLFIYYGAREQIGLIPVDSGSYIRDAIKVVYNQGAPRETGWPYLIEKFAKKPLKRVYKSAPYHKITSYRSVPVDVAEVKKALAEDYPVVVGFAVFNSFFNDQAGNINYPSQYDYMIGGHAVLLVGYDDATGRFKFRNSWGPSWGTGGYGTIPYGYISNPNLSDDFWVLTDSEYKERFESV